MKKNKIPSLYLYLHYGCIFCQSILDYLEKMNKTLTIKDTKAHPLFQKELLDHTGKKEVPCLLVDNKPLYESKSIILWLEEHRHLLNEAQLGKNL